MAVVLKLFFKDSILNIPSQYKVPMVDIRPSLIMAHQTGSNAEVAVSHDAPGGSLQNSRASLRRT
jgi:hypothetical protein